jgi:hypothetical protein
MVSGTRLVVLLSNLRQQEKVQDTVGCLQQEKKK